MEIGADRMRSAEMSGRSWEIVPAAAPADLGRAAPPAAPLGGVSAAEGGGGAPGAAPGVAVSSDW